MSKTDGKPGRAVPKSGPVKEPKENKTVQKKALKQRQSTTNYK
jgi:hypothetical protein